MTHPPMNPIRRLARLFLLLTLTVLARAADLPRVAVVPDSPESSIAAFADLLSASLATTSDRYALVERAELTKLAAEAEIQKLAADQRPSALAKLAKADGSIIVGADKGDPKFPKFTLRLTSTINGLVLRSLTLGGTEKEFAEAAALAAGVLRFPCERLTHGDAKPPIIVSLLGIRPAIEIDRALETTLNLAVAQQLSAQSGIAVSERWRMNDLVFERSLADQIPQAFATGTVLLDGSTNREGDQLAVTLRLRNSESDPGRAILVSGDARKPDDLAKRLTAEVVGALGTGSGTAAWDATKEGQQYADLGWWLFRRKQADESAQAYEAAIALGYREKFTLRNRFQAYGSMVTPGLNLPIYDTEVDGLDHLPKDKFKHLIAMMIRATQCAIEAHEGNWGGLSKKELDDDGRATNLTYQLKYNMKVLQALCLRREQLELATEARALRAASRHLDKVGRDLQENFGGGFVNRTYMYDSPEDAGSDLRRLLDPKLLNDNHWCRAKSLRDGFWGTFHDPNLWHFVDWTATDNRRGEETWRRFITELGVSKLLINQADSLAFSFQNTRDEKKQNGILNAYCDLLESRFDEVVTPAGQRVLCTFKNYPYRQGDKNMNATYETRMAGIMARVFRSGNWVGTDTILATSISTTAWCRAMSKGQTVVPESRAIELLDAVENYLAWAKNDPRWKSDYQNPHHQKLDQWLAGITEKIVKGYPNLAKARIKRRLPIPGAVAIQAWKPQVPGHPDSTNWLFGEAMISSGNSLFVPRINEGIVELDTSTMTVSRLIGLPLKGFNFIGYLACNRNSMMITIKNRMFRTPLSGNGSSWGELKPPGDNGGDGLTWTLRGFNDDFFVGSCNTSSESTTPRMLAGLVGDAGDVRWLAASNRRPTINLIDNLDPRGAVIAYRNTNGKTMALLGGRMDRAPLVELETGKEAASLSGNGVDQMRGELPVYWGVGNNMEGYGIHFLVVFDPSREQPRLILRSAKGAGKLPEMWKNVQPLCDVTKPEFQGQFIAAIVHGGYLWLLKREAEVSAEVEKNDPEGFRLIRVGLSDGKAVSIPLSYQVPESIRKLGKGDQANDRSSLERPIINVRSLTATPRALFFASSGYGPDCRWYGDQLNAGDLAPVLLYITWEDISAWLAKNAPESAKPASP
ncbi:MAG: hypothetical protein ABI600_15860 [Luteolibacter sp.]